MDLDLLCLTASVLPFSLLALNDRGETGSRAGYLGCWEGSDALESTKSQRRKSVSQSGRNVHGSCPDWERGKNTTAETSFLYPTARSDSGLSPLLRKHPKLTCTNSIPSLDLATDLPLALFSAQLF